jgi:hypothetical protein
VCDIINFKQYGSIPALNQAFGDHWVYIGRANSYAGLEQSPLTNPFKVRDFGGRGKTLPRYRRWLWERIQAGDTAVLNAGSDQTHRHTKSITCFLQLAHVYSDGQQIWASDRYSLHALDVATEKSGRVTVREEGTFQVDEAGDISPSPLPCRGRVYRCQRGEIEAGCRQSEGFVRLNLYGSNQALELSSGGKYALVMPIMDVPEWWFWRPESND